LSRALFDYGITSNKDSARTPLLTGLFLIVLPKELDCLSKGALVLQY